MDQIKIGQFIKATRKEKGYTQREIAEKLNISEKTVSKWETGNGLPEVSLMLPLCTVLGINVNELLSGKRLNEAQYFEKAEENMLSLVCDRTSSQKKIGISAVTCTLILLCGAGLVSVASFVALPTAVRILLIVSAFLACICQITVILLVAVSVEVFECANCGRKFVPTLHAYILGPHTLRKRYLRCPHCGKKSWAVSHLKTISSP